MRKIIVSTFMTLDGIGQDPGGFGETEHGGWALRYFDDEAVEAATEQVLASDTFLLGRRTYQVLERAWSKNTGPYAEALHNIRQDRGHEHVARVAAVERDGAGR